MVRTEPEPARRVALVSASIAYRPTRDEFELVGLERAPSVRIAPPRVVRAKAHLECEVRQIVPVGTSSLVVGEVVHLHCDPSIRAAGGRAGIHRWVVDDDDGDVAVELEANGMVGHDSIR